MYYVMCLRVGNGKSNEVTNRKSNERKHRQGKVTGWNTGWNHDYELRNDNFSQYYEDPITNFLTYGLCKSISEF